MELEIKVVKTNTKIDKSCFDKLDYTIIHHNAKSSLTSVMGETCNHCLPYMTGPTHEQLSCCSRVVRWLT